MIMQQIIRVVKYPPCIVITIETRSTCIIYTYYAWVQYEHAQCVCTHTAEHKYVASFENDCTYLR